MKHEPTNKSGQIEKRPPTAKYELTLAEFPVFILSKTGKPLVKVIEYRDQITGKEGKPVERAWRVYPDSKHGFGGPSAQATLFELFQIWKEQGFDSPSVKFGTVHNIVKRRGLTKNKRTYDTIRRDLYCLVGMRIEADNAFWDNEKKAYVDMTFHLFDDVYLYKERPTGQATLSFAWIKASDVLWRSVEANSLLTTTFDSKFFHSLTPLEQRLALYLSKMFRSQDQHRRELLQLAKTLPLHTKQKKQIKYKLKKATQALVDKGFTPLGYFFFEKTADGKSELMVFVRSGTLYLPFPQKTPRRPDVQTHRGKNKDEFEIQIMVSDLVALTGDKKSKNFFFKICNLLPSDTIYRIIGEVKEEFEPFGGRSFKGSRGMLVTVKAKKYAEELRIDLGLKE